MQRRAWRQTIARDYSSKLNLGRDNGILAGDAGKHGGVLVVDSLVVDEIESGHEMEFRAAEFGLEGSEITPRMLWVVCRGDSPQVVTRVTQRFGFAHDLEMEKVRRHHVAMNVS